MCENVCIYFSFGNDPSKDIADFRSLRFFFFAHILTFGIFQKNDAHNCRRIYGTNALRVRGGSETRSPFEYQFSVHCSCSESCLADLRVYFLHRNNGRTDTILPRRFGRSPLQYAAASSQKMHLKGAEESRYTQCTWFKVFVNLLT